MGEYFKHLNYTLGDEDASFEMHALQSAMGHVLAIADCGSRIVPLLAKSPNKLTCVDISPLQLAIVKLRLALLQHCDLDTYSAFLGYRGDMSAAERQAIFEVLSLNPEDAQTLRSMLASIRWDGPVYYGKFERMLLTLSRITRTLTGKGPEGLFECKTLDEQRDYFKRSFPHGRWRIVLSLLGNSTALNSLLYKGEFPKKNIEQSYYSIYREIFERLFTQHLARGSFFLQLIFLGQIRYEEGLPIECHPDVFWKAKAALAKCDVQCFEGDIFAATGMHRDIDFLSFSDVPSFLPDDIAYQCLQTVRPNLAPEALVIVRGHVRIVRPALDGFRDTSLAHKGLADMESTQLWTINTYQLV